ncbi:hypothetical protein SO802_009578 [Lithocarpus litseifolius]|uniref:Uncharacterized protein n=1 Tax=Lithocarpus litseifolius TaxID=425828 RepID=A0AAW2DHE0_9ROSI
MLSMCIVMTSLLKAWQTGRAKYQAVCSTPSPNSFLFTFFKAEDKKYPDFESYLICLNCINCSAELWIRSDPENKDYVVVSGATKKRVEEDEGQDKQNWR